MPSQSLGFCRSGNASLVRRMINRASPPLTMLALDRARHNGSSTPVAAMVRHGSRQRRLLAVLLASALSAGRKAPEADVASRVNDMSTIFFVLGLPLGSSARPIMSPYSSIM